MLRAHQLIAMSVLLGSLSLMGCTHKVEVAAKEPITINLNVKIEHEVKVKVEKDLEDLFDDESSDLF
ncbi:MAG: YnbE family lipoprotein [Pseudomonadales bacterium]|nr:YnbE family lipoprotein [Pseudomonadales bacterium]